MHEICLATLCPLRISLVHTLADNPYFTWFAIFKTSSSVSNGWTVITGPNISSVAHRLCKGSLISRVKLVLFPEQTKNNKHSGAGRDNKKAGYTHSTRAHTTPRFWWRHGKSNVNHASSTEKYKKTISSQIVTSLKSRKKVSIHAWLAHTSPTWSSERESQRSII